jgi:hypothetical protein
MTRTTEACTILHEHRPKWPWTARSVAFDHQGRSDVDLLGSAQLGQHALEASDLREQRHGRCWNSALQRGFQLLRGILKQSY